MPYVWSIYRFMFSTLDIKKGGSQTSNLKRMLWLRMMTLGFQEEGSKKGCCD